MSALKRDAPLTTRGEKQRQGHQESRHLAKLSGGRDPALLRRLLEDDGHAVDRDSKTLCPFHSESTPSLHVFDDERGGHLHCFGCGAHGDAITYLVEYRRLTTREALDLVDGPSRQPVRRLQSLPVKRNKGTVRECTEVALPERVIAAHMASAARLDRMPATMDGRGFTLGDLLELNFAAVNDAAIFPITGPDSQVLRLKRRAAPMERGARYRYWDADGSGTPAWCSPSFGDASTTLVVEGELNGMACWLARRDLDVVGVAGTSGTLPLSALAGRQVVVYADGDRPGQRAAAAWALALHQLGCRVSTLEAWTDGDACDVAGALGRVELSRRLA